MSCFGGHLFFDGLLFIMASLLDKNFYGGAQSFVRSAVVCIHGLVQAYWAKWAKRFLTYLVVSAPQHDSNWLYIFRTCLTDGLVAAWCTVCIKSQLSTRSTAQFDWNLFEGERAGIIGSIRCFPRGAKGLRSNLCWRSHRRRHRCGLLP